MIRNGVCECRYICFQAQTTSVYDRNDAESTGMTGTGQTEEGERRSARKRRKVRVGWSMW